MTRSATLAASCLLALTAVASAQTMSAKSPDGHLELRVTTDAAGRLQYDVTRDGRALLLPAQLGITVDGRDLGYGAKPGAAKSAAGRDAFAVSGVHARADVSFTDITLPVRTGDTDWQLQFRLFDDAVAFRYVVPGTGTRHVGGEASEFHVEANMTIFSQLHTPGKDYEGRYHRDTAPSIPDGTMLAAPALIKLRDGDGYAFLTEANLVNYTDMALTKVNHETYRAIFHNDAGGFELQGDITTPWRVAILAKDLNTLVNTDVLRSLCPPPAKELQNADWIKPGRAAWHWRVTGHPKLEQQHDWVDWTSALGFEYYLVDDGWRDWKKGDQTAWPLLKEVVDYGKSKNVAVWAWAHSHELDTPEKRRDYMTHARDIGLAGLKIDFMRPANVQWVKWYDDTLRDAAEFHLMIDFHGALKPTGRDRTWPNELTREGISGREQGKLPGVHDTTLPFVRFVQGNADYTPFETRARELGGNTVAKELAQAVVYTSPLLCYSGDPADYLKSPALDVLKTIPPAWDETIVLPGTTPGDVAAFARRKGDAWYVGVINGEKARDLPVRLSFLKDGNYAAVVLADTPGQPATFARDEKTVTAADRLTATMSKDGGYVVRLTPANHD